MTLKQKFKKQKGEFPKAGVVGIESEWLQIGTLEIPTGSLLAVDVTLFNADDGHVTKVPPGKFIVEGKAMDFNGHLRVSVEGRADDFFAYGDLRVHPLAMRSVFVKTAEVSEYQVRQTERGIDAAVVAHAPVDCAMLAARLREALASAGLREPAVAVARVDRLPRHPETGKLARFVPLRSTA